MNLIIELENQFNRMLKVEKINGISIKIEEIEPKIFKILYNNKFLFYFNTNEFAQNELLGKHNKKWDTNKIEIIRKIKKLTKMSPINHDIICLVNMHDNHNILLKTVSSLNRQINKPHMIVLISSESDKKFAISCDLEYSMSNENTVGVKFQNGLNYVKDKYPNISGILLSSGHEIFPEHWITEVLKISKNYDVIGADHDYMVDSKCNKVYYRELNHEKYNAYLEEEYQNSYILFYGSYFKKELILKLKWDIFPNIDNGIELSTFKNCMNIKSKIGNIKNTGFITLYQGVKSYSIKYLIAKNFIIANEIDINIIENTHLIKRYNLLQNNEIVKVKPVTITKNVIYPVAITRINRQTSTTFDPYAKRDEKINPEMIFKLSSSSETKVITHQQEKITPDNSIESINSNKIQKNNSLNTLNTSNTLKNNFGISGKTSESKNTLSVAKYLEPKLNAGLRFSAYNIDDVKMRITPLNGVQVNLNLIFNYVYVLCDTRNEDNINRIDRLMSRYNIIYEKIDIVNSENATIKKEFSNLLDTSIKSIKEYVYLLTHMKAIELARKNNYQNILIFENNIHLHNDFNTMISKLMIAPNDWILLYLGDKQKYTDVLNTNFLIAKDVKGSFAYAVKKDCYTEILRHLSQMNKSIDDSLIAYQKLKKCYVLHPNPVLIRTISNTENDNLMDLEYSQVSMISIVLPTLNGFPLIQRAINSIFNQSYKNWELIIVDDGSTQKELKNYLSSLKFKKIKIKTLVKNGGLPNALNEGIKACTGSFWTWISDDNEFRYDAFAELKLKIDNGNDFAYSDYETINEFRNNAQKIVPLSEYNHGNIRELWKGMPCYLWKMDIVNKIKGFDINLFGAEDYDFVIKTFVISNKVSHINKPLMKYYKRTGTITTKMGQDKIVILKNKVNENYSNIYAYKEISLLLNNKCMIVMFNNDGNYDDFFDKSDYGTIIIIKNSNKLYKKLNSKIIISQDIFDEYLDKFKIGDTSIILIYDNQYFKKYNNVIEHDKVLYCVYDFPIKQELLDEYDSIVMLKNNDKISHLNNIIYSKHQFDEYLNGIDKCIKKIFTIGLLGDLNNINFELQKLHATELFEFANIVKLEKNNLNNIDFIVVMCDSASLRYYWKSEYAVKNIYFVNFRINNDIDCSKIIEGMNIKYISVFGNAEINTQYFSKAKITPVKSNIIFDKFMDNTREFMGVILDSVDNYDGDKMIDEEIKFIIYNGPNMKQSLNFINDIKINKIIKIVDNSEELMNELLTCKKIYTDNLYISLFCKSNDIEICNAFDECDTNNVNINNDLLNAILYNNLRVVHFGSYWQFDNDIVKLMVNDLKKTYKTVEIDTKIFDGDNVDDYTSEWLVNVEPDKINYAGKYIRYLSDDKIKHLISVFKPHMLITNSGGMTFSEKMFRHLKKNHVITIGISLSDPDVFPYNGKYYAHKYDYFCTNSEHSLNTEYNKNNTMLMPFACSTEIHKPLNIPKKYDVIVVAGARSERVEVIDELKKHFNVGVYGGGWPHEYHAIKVNGDEHVMALNSGHIYISFSQTVAGYTNVKVGLFEAASCKLALITSEFDEVKRYFDIDKEILTYKTIDELVKKIDILLKDKNKLEILKINSYNRFLKEHQWNNRWNKLFVDVLDKKLKF